MHLKLFIVPLKKGDKFEKFKVSRMIVHYCNFIDQKFFGLFIFIYNTK